MCEFEYFVCSCVYLLACICVCVLHLLCVCVCVRVCVCAACILPLSGYRWDVSHAERTGVVRRRRGWMGGLMQGGGVG